jgi:hypothetical protein
VAETLEYVSDSTRTLISREFFVDWNFECSKWLQTFSLNKINQSLHIKYCVAFCQCSEDILLPSILEEKARISTSYISYVFVFGVPMLPYLIVQNYLQLLLL